MHKISIIYIGKYFLPVNTILKFLLFDFNILVIDLTKSVPSRQELDIHVYIICHNHAYSLFISTYANYHYIRPLIIRDSQRY